MALNLVRNSKVFFTTNVNATTGVIASSGFTSSNTFELQVLDGFTFSQNTNQETVTVSEAGALPVRGQRSFNTSLAPVDFSFSTYLRPALVSNEVTAEEKVLWNALLSSTAIDAAPISFGSTGTATYTFSNGVGTLGITGLTLSSIPTVGSYITLSGLTHASQANFLNAAYKVLTSTVNALSLQMVNPYGGNISTIGAPSTAKVYTSTGWATNGSSYAIATAAGSNKNQLQKFGMLFLVDQILYAVDNASMTQVSIDFGLDAIATAAWTGQATVLRRLAEGASISITGGAISTFTESLSTGTVANATATSATINLTTATASNLAAGHTVVATSSVGTVGANATVTSVSKDNTGKVTSFTITTTAANTNGSITAITATILAAGSYATKNTSAGYLTNKISTVTLTLVNDLKDALNATVAPSGTAYSVALTGGSFTLNNNVTYVTPANLNVVNLPVTSFTGTRAISGSLSAYLKTGVGVGDTGQLLNDLLTSSTITTEPMFALTVKIGGPGTTRIEVELPSTVLSIPTIDVQQVVSTNINFTAQGSVPTSTSAGTYSLTEVNDLTVRYYAA